MMMAKLLMANKCTSILGLFDMAVLRDNTDGIAQCGMSRAASKAIGRPHQATTHSVLPQQPPGQKANK